MVSSLSVPFTVNINHRTADAQTIMMGETRHDILSKLVFNLNTQQIS